MTFQVMIVPKAEQDVEEIVVWIRRRSPEGAQAWRRAWSDAIDSLKQDADRCNLAAESHRYPLTLLQKLFKTRHGRRYRILLTVQENIVFILRVRGPGQNLLRRKQIPLPESPQTN